MISNVLAHRQIGDLVRRIENEFNTSAPQTVVPGYPNPYQPGSPNNPTQIQPGIPGYPFQFQNPGQAPPPPRSPRNLNLSFILAGILGLFLALVLGFALAGRISSPLAKLTKASKNLMEGEYSTQVHVSGGKEVEELTDAFNSLSQNLETNELLRKNMVADIAHELRNPLATLKGQIELLQDGKVEPTREALDSLAEDAELLSCLVEDLRQLSIAEAGKLELELAPVAPAEVLEESRSRFENEANSKEIELATRAAEDLPSVDADRLRVAQVLANLVNNSLRHTPRGGRVTLSAELSGDEVLFSVEDTGIGVGEDELPYLFERFYRADSSRTRATGGAGLGLSIARSLVKAHGGRIWAQSTLGIGTTIHFTLPVSKEVSAGV